MAAKQLWQYMLYYYMANFKTGSSQIYLWKALFIKQNSKMVSVDG